MTFMVHDANEIDNLLIHDPRIGHGDKIVLDTGGLLQRWEVYQHWGKGALTIRRERFKGWLASLPVVDPVAEEA